MRKRDYFGENMLRGLLAVVIFGLVGCISAQAQVQTVGDVSFSLIEGWQYQPGADFGALTIKTGTSFWLLAVYTSMPSNGNVNADFTAAWNRVLAPTGYPVPGYSPYKLGNVIGYPGAYYEGASSNGTTLARLYLLETGKRCVPVVFISQNRQVLDGMGHNAQALIGSVRVAPLQASPIKFSITLGDLVGHWAGGIVTSIDYYNPSGQHSGSSLSAMRFGYTIAADGSYTYKYGGLMNNQMTSGDDSGVVVLESGFLTFKGRRYTSRHRFVNMQQALDGSTVLTLWPDADISRIDSSRDSTYFTRPVKQ